MRTTVDLPDELFRRVKASSAMRGWTMKRFFREALERELRRRASPPRPRRVKLPLVSSASPASVKLSNERAAQLLDEEERNVSP